MKLFVIVAFLLITNPEINNIEKGVKKVQLSGTVIEDITGEPIPGATIILKELNKEIYTDFDGNFTIEDLTPGKYNLEVNFVSFKKKELNALEITNEKNTLLIRLN